MLLLALLKAPGFPISPSRSAASCAAISHSHTDSMPMQRTLVASHGGRKYSCPLQVYAYNPMYSCWGIAELLSQEICKWASWFQSTSVHVQIMSQWGICWWGARGRQAVVSELGGQQGLTVVTCTCCWGVMPPGPIRSPSPAPGSRPPARFPWLALAVMPDSPARLLEEPFRLELDPNSESPTRFAADP